MFSNYIKLTLRHLQRNGRYLLINVLGLGFALGFGILAYLNYNFSNTFDAQHRDAARIVRVEVLKESSSERYGMCPALLGPVAVGQLTGVESQCRYDSRSTVVKQGDKVFNEGLNFADENFFQFFDFELIAGSADLSDHKFVVIGEEMALKYFGTDDPIGQTLIFYADTDQKMPLTVGGVLKNIPLNSSLRFDFLTHLDNQLENAKPVDYGDWRWRMDAVFLKLKNASDKDAVEAGLQVYAAAHNTARPDWTINAFRLDPLLEMADNSRNLRWNNLWQGVPPSAVWGNVTMAILLLLTAALNFANMTIAVCNRRLREMGVRKVMGGTRGQLVRQLLGEAFAVVALGMALGMILAYPICDWFNATWNFSDLRVDYTSRKLLLYIAGSAVFTTLLAGSYPAFYLSSFRPASIFRGGVLFGGRNIFSQVLMGFQIAISLVTVVVGLSFARNAEHNRTADIGFEYRPILQAWLPNPTDFERFHDAVREIPGVEAAGGSVHLPGFAATNIEFPWNGEQVESSLYQVGNNFTGLMGMRLAQGSWPSPAGDTSVSAEVVVNQTFAREIAGNRPVIGEIIVFRNRPHRISGVVADFMTNSPFNPIRPSILHPVPARNFQRCLIKTSSTAQQPQVMAALENKWKQLFPYTPFNIGYQNEMLRQAIEVSDNVATTMFVFAGIAILLTITGLFSLVSLNVLRRLREVAVRRVMGASAGHIAWILNKNYILVFFFAILAGCIGGWVLARLLMDSIFRINIGVHPGVLIYGTFGILAVAAATIGLKIWQTLRVNPADVLRGD
jgi:putative ABC transport system permease protein